MAVRGTVKDPLPPDMYPTLLMYTDVLALVADHVSVAVPVGEYEAGFGESVTEQAGAKAVTVTVAERESLPPAPVQVTEYVVEDDGETETLPDVAPPVENPVPVQEVALADDHVSVEEFPFIMLVGLAESAAVGAADAEQVKECAVVLLQ